jgi:nitroimidazol reductase NimA-like FMN-containing flavoprotein (pyridoxamine 5'-phosphate oxidase superfamily)
VEPHEINTILDRPLGQELLARDIARLAYTALDQTPRVIPIAFTWNGTGVVMCSPPNAPKVRALQTNRMVALTIDTEDHPPTILLVRGHAELNHVDGIPEEFVEANTTASMSAEQRVEWEAGVRSLYRDGMVRIVVTPTWAKLIDFDETLPQAVDELMRQQARQGTREK